MKKYKAIIYDLDGTVLNTINMNMYPLIKIKCLKRLSLQPEDVIYIGDAHSDYLASKNAGIDFGYAKWGSVSAKGIDKPDHVFEQPLDLLKLLS